MFKKHHKRHINFANAYEKMDDLIGSLPWNKKKPKRFFWRITGRLILFTITFLFLLAIIAGGFLAWRLYGVYDLASSAKDSLEISIDSAKGGDFEIMLSEAKKSEEYFGSLLAELEKLKKDFLLDKSPAAEKQMADLERLVKSLALISQTVRQAAVIGGEADKILSGKLGENFSSFSSDEKRRLLKLFYESSPDLAGMKANLDLALLDLEDIKGKGFLKPLDQKINNIREQLKKNIFSVSNLILASEIAPRLAGYPQKSAYLVLFQNNMELRPTGGFIGTYGILETENGDIVRFDSHDVYHMDMPLEAQKKFQITPPDPIKLYLNKNWYLRDSNWSPDWPTAARQIEWFWQKENSLLDKKNNINNFSGNFNGLIGITPDFVTSLMVLTGPITVRGEVFTADNFSNLLEYKVEQDFAKQDISSWQRKEIISDILEELKIKLFNLNYREWPAAGKILLQNIAEKNILVSFKDPILNNLAEKFKASGEVKSAPGDFVMAVDANLGAYKTDAVMDKKIKYFLEEKKDGFYAKVILSYDHKGNYDWKTGDYKSFTRLYVPLGSKLIKASSPDRGGVVIGEEVGKTTFGLFFTVKPKNKKDIIFEYKLPDNFIKYYNQNGYDLYVQKQPGNKQNFEVDLKFQKEVKSYNLIPGIEVAGNKEIKGETDLKTDQEISVKF